MLWIGLDDDPTTPGGPMDTDMDGVPDDEDAFPNDPAASVDDDMDGMPDAWNDGATQEQIDASGLMLDDDPTTPVVRWSQWSLTSLARLVEQVPMVLVTSRRPRLSRAGFANLNTELYPITLEEGGRIVHGVGG